MYLNETCERLYRRLVAKAATCEVPEDVTVLKELGEILEAELLAEEEAAARFKAKQGAELRTVPATAAGGDAA